MTWLFSKRGAIYAGLSLLIISLFWLPRFDADVVQLGVTFDPVRAESLGLDPVKTFEHLVSELHPDVVRIPVAWDRLEKVRGEHAYDQFDKYIIAARRNQVRVILSIGPRQPSPIGCAVPSWLNDMSDVERAVALRNLFLVTSSHFKTHQNIAAWQIEESSESFMTACAPLTDEIIAQESALVRARDQRPILVTEISSADISDESRTEGGWYGAPVNKTVIPPFVTYLKILVRGAFGENRSFVGLVTELSDPSQFAPYVSYARATGASIILINGVEDWYAARAAGNDAWIITAQQIFALL